MDKICFNIVVCKQNHYTKTIPFYNTICKDIVRDGNEFLFISGFDKFDDIPVLRLSEKDDYSSNVEKTLQPFLYHYLNNTNFDWMFIGDDDTFLNTVNLNSLVNKLSKDDLAVYGYVNAGWILPGWGKFVEEEKNNILLHLHGGTGFFCNKKTADAIGFQYKIRQTRHFYGDMTFGFVIEDHNNRSKEKIKLVNIDEMAICDKKKITECNIEKLISLHLKTKPDVSSVEDVYKFDYKKEGIKNIDVNFEYKKYYFYDILNCLISNL